MNAGEIAIIGSITGASIALVTQVLVFQLSKSKEKKNQIRELIADERRIAYMLTAYYKDLVMHKVHKQYWYRTSEIHYSNTEDRKDSHSRHFKSNEKAFNRLNDIRVTTAEYFKVVTSFTILTGENKIIQETLDKIKSFVPRKASTFAEVKTYSELLKAQGIEEDSLNDVYLYYSDCYNKINQEMIKRVN